jgi:transcriptional regulator with XRE-family HTH domain
MLRVQELCKEKGITMQELALRLGVTYQALYASLSGNPTIGKLNEIAGALGVSFFDLFNKSEDNVIYCPHCNKPLKVIK